VSTRPYSWHEHQWQRIVNMQSEARLPHALLLRGPQGVGKLHFAEHLVAALLCEHGNFEKRPCDGCRGCRLVSAATHPDMHLLTPLEGKQQIGIDQVRELIHRIGLTSQYRGPKAVVVAPAERMTRAAANTLLKTLEEPPGDSVFVLVADRAGALPATIRSRCQNLDFPVPPAEAALTWLAAKLDSRETAESALRLADGAPVAARRLVAEGGLQAREAILDDLRGLASGGGDVVATAQRWREVGLVPALHWLQSMVCDLVRLKNGRLAHSLTHSDRADALQELARGLDLMRLFRLFDLQIEARRAALGGLNFNEQLTLESIAIEWQRSGA